MRLKTIYCADDPELTESDELRYVSEEGLQRWRSSNETFAKLPESTRRTFRELYQGALEMVGVPMLSGSVAHLHEIDGVVRAGQYLDRAALDALLEKAAVERPGF